MDTSKTYILQLYNQVVIVINKVYHFPINVNSELSVKNSRSREEKCKCKKNITR